MYSSFQLAKKYINYQLTASNGKGHGIHSPFVFDFVNKILNDDSEQPCYARIEQQRKALLHDATLIEVEDFGAGSAVIRSNRRRISAIAASSLKPKKYARLLNRMVNYYKPQTILELGTSFGITTAYLASANENANVFTCEGSPAIAAIARQNFDTLGLKNIELTEGDFSTGLSPLLNRLKKIDFAFVDGNHRKVPTGEYFTKILQQATPSTILVFDDIHWSADMEEAWEAIKSHETVTLTIDLFFMGLVFLNTDINHTQHFTIRF